MLNNTFDSYFTKSTKEIDSSEKKKKCNLNLTAKVSAKPPKLNKEQKLALASMRAKRKAEKETKKKENTN